MISCEIKDTINFSHSETSTYDIQDFYTHLLNKKLKDIITSPLSGDCYLYLQVIVNHELTLF